MCEGCDVAEAAALAGVRAVVTSAVGGGGAIAAAVSGIAGGRVALGGSMAFSLLLGGLGGG